tara:strand:- start:630 stop:1481 length:852 start_codon:yes stop_codon:yes gene_type:complete
MVNSVKIKLMRAKIALLLLLSVGAFAAQIPTPTQFAAGQRIVASQVNSNFTAVNSVVNGNIASDNIVAGGIVAGNLSTDSVTTAKILALNVTTAKLAAGSVTNAKLEDLGITSDKIAVSGVATANIATGSIITAKVASESITRVKQAALGQVITGSVTFTTTSATFVDVTDATVTLTHSGRPVFVGVVSDGTDNAATFQATSASVPDVSAEYKILRGSTVVARGYICRTGTGIADVATCNAPVSVWGLDHAPAGTYVYKLQVKAVSASTTVNANFIKMVAFEL